MSRPALILAVCVLVVCRVAAAQEQRGSIEGIVKDASGAIVPGATVEARSPALVGGATAVTDVQGSYRFPSLSPGIYEIAATLQGFNPAKAGGVRLELIDTGKGMSPEVVAKAFQPFFSTKPAGSGLGLPTTRKIVEAHGGTIEVQSEVDRGTKFTIRLPALAVRPESTP